MSQQFDDPNREAVGLPPAWVEGTGGRGAAEPESEPTDAERLDAMTKDQLLDEAEARGVEADSSMTKAEIREALGA